MMRRPCSASQFDPKFTVITTKHPGRFMVWEASSGNLGRDSLYFVPKNVTIKRSIYINISKEHLCTFFRIHQCESSYMMVPQLTTRRSRQNFLTSITSMF